MSGSLGGSASQPLRIHKHTASQDLEAASSVSSAASSSSKSQDRLSELAAIESRRNSVQAIEARRNSIQLNTKHVARRFGEDMAHVQAITGRAPASPRAFWLQENAKVKDSPNSPRRSSIENLKKASRVQNNKLLKNEVLGVPPSPVRPISLPPQPAGSPLKFERSASKVNRPSGLSPKKNESTSPPPPRVSTPTMNIPLTSIMRNEATPIRSPGKSALVSSYKVNGDDTDGEDSVQQSPTRRKAVTFQEQSHVVEYELVTPVPSVDGSPSMSYDSQDEETDDDDYDYDNTPVMEPGDQWNNAPERVATPPRLGDPFRATPSPTGTGRPLPPLPGTPLSRTDSNSSNRPLPNLPFKTQIQSQQQISLHEKMQMMMQRSEDEPLDDPNEELAEHNRPDMDSALGITFDAPSDAQDESDDSTEDGHDPRKETSLDDHDSASSAHAMQFDEEFEFKRPKKISRDSIRRHVNEQMDDESAAPSECSEVDNRARLETVMDESDADSIHEGDGQVIPNSAFNDAEVASRFSSPSPYFDVAESVSSETTDAESDSKYGEHDGSSDSDSTTRALTPRAHSPTAAEQVPSTSTSDAPPAAPINLFEFEAPVLPHSVPTSPPTPPKDEDENEQRVNISLPDFQSSFGEDSLGLRDFLTPSPPPMKTVVAEKRIPSEPTPEVSPQNSLRQSATPVLTNIPILLPPLNSSQISLNDRPSTPDGQRLMVTEDLERTPESVIRHKIHHSDEESDYDESYYDEEGSLADGETRSLASRAESRVDSIAESSVADSISIRVETPVEPKARTPSPIPEDSATIRAPGGKLRTRPSATPADMAAMAAQRRQVSGDHTRIAAQQSSSESDADDVSDEDDYESDANVVETLNDDTENENENENENDNDKDKGKAPERKASRRSLKLPTLDELDIDLSLDDIDQEFDRVIETQKRGYLMRHSTRVIHATSRDVDDEPSRPGHKRAQSWQVEPWKNGSRRKSGRTSIGLVKPADGAVPPVPGQPEVTSKDGGASVNVDANGDKVEANPESNERGRLFVKVIGVKDLTLPLPQREQTWFCLTLDNGLHCVTTSWLELAKNAPIGQEFELVVLNDLEFQLTLQTKLEKPAPKPVIAQTPVPAPTPLKAPPKARSTFSKVFSSPKKRRELEKQREEEQRLAAQQQQQQQQQAQAQKTQPEEPLSAWELLNGVVARDGSFARSYVCLKDFERQAYGRPFITEINCFNEWAIEPGSVNSKKRGVAPSKRPPYKIGKLEVQMLFVPKPPGLTDKDLPKSMAAAIREIKEAESMVARSWEGYLSQQGGDCPYWRRRYFKLVGVKLTAYHEVSRQPRATINLTKATRLIDDRPSLTQPEVPGSGGKRRKSAFSEMEEGYMFVEEGFRIKFANGETIDFYADNAEDKKGWMKVLGETIGGGEENKTWCEMILNKEKHDRESALAAQQRRLQQQQQQHQQFEKAYFPDPASAQPMPPPRSPGGGGGGGPSANGSRPPLSGRRPVSGVPQGYPHGSQSSLGR